MKLLIIEDDETMQTALRKGFHKHGYIVDSAYDGEEAVEIFFSGEHSLIILDLNLPKLSGMEVLKEIRLDNKEIPVLILSAKSTVEDKVTGLDEGANDYLAKPFHFSELEARVRALLRRNFKTADTVVMIGSVRMDTASKKVFVASKEIPLNKKEYSITEYLVLQKGKIITPAELTARIWENDSEDAFNSLKVRLSSIRKKLPDGFIKNARGHGYYVEG